VENAVRHAIAPRSDGGTIGINASVHNGSLVLRVDDDGPGAGTQDLGLSRGIGLPSLKRRLEARYGADARVDIRTSPGAGFSVTVVLPSGEAALSGVAR
jgi:two-component system, LytTR family, sensor kinase